MLALAAHGWTLAGVDQRHRARRLPGAARAAHLRPGRPGAALPAPRAAGRHRADRGRPADPRRRRGRGRRRVAEAAVGARPRGRSTWPTRSTTSSTGAAATALLARRRAAADAGCSPTWSAPASPPTPTTWPTCSREFAGRGQGRRRRRRTPSVGREFNLGSPKQLQEILFDELGLPKTKRIKTGYTTDADALAWLYAQTDAPAARAPAAAPRRVPRSRPWSTGLIPIGRRRRPHPHHVQPDRSRPPAGCPRTDPNLQNIPIRTAEGRRIRRGVRRRRRASRRC